MKSAHHLSSFQGSSWEKDYSHDLNRFDWGVWYFWVFHHLTERYQTARIGCTLSSPLPVCYGVPQWSILGPLLFTLYTNELPNIVSNCEIESYMDDTKLFLSFTSFDTDLELASASQDLHRVVEWLCEHQLIINPDKKKFILFGTKQQLGQLLNPTELDSWQDL